MTIRSHVDDLPDLSHYQVGVVAIDTETLGLIPQRDRLCVVQLSPGDGTADVVQIRPGRPAPPNLCALLTDPRVIKLFHFARFDVAVLKHATDRHGLKDLSRELLGIDMSKVQQSSDWAAETLTAAQLDYAASDVLHLHALKDKLDMMLARENRTALAAACFAFLPTRAELDLAGWPETDIFAHS
ncbi:MAG: ribonuclease D [Xanthobacteraceae bacterium]|nr:MAG: ribonuclease D [Xanthobacteraceae bacterium]